MKQWNGLLKKEWVSMKGWFYGMIMASALFILVFPLVISMFFTGVDGSVEMGLTSVLPIWLLLSMFVPGIVLFMALGKETVHPDIWLHSPVSVFTLFGAKAIFAAFVSAVNLLISALLLSFQFGLIHEISNFIFDGETIQNGSLLVFILFALSVMVMCIGLFFRVLFLVIKPYTKKLTSPIIIVLFFFSSWLLTKTTESEIYKKISEFGPIGNPEKKIISIEKESSYFWIDGSVFHVGEILLSGTFIALLFVTAAVLFEKKVGL